MKKFTFMLIALMCAVVTFAAGPKRQFEAQLFTPKANVQLGQMFNAKQAPAGLTKKVATAKARAPKKAAAAADFVGDYTWDYETSSETSTDLESLTTSAGSSHVVIAESTTTEGGITISGMFTYDLEATVENDEYGSYFQIKGGQLAGTSSYGDYIIYGLFYYAGDEEYSEGWYYDNIYGYLEEDGTITIEPWLCRVLSGGQYDGYSLTPYYVVGSTLTPAEPLAPVELPEGVEVKGYVMTYDGGSTPVNVAVDGNDVYFQGMSYYIPEAWVKGTKDGNAVTFAAMQYMGEYGSYGVSYFFYNGETVFTYDAEADTYSAEGQVYGVLADTYYDGNYTNPVIAPVVEKAVMPADPEVTDFSDSNYGYIVEFNVPLMDVNGDPIVASKLSYMIYTDTEGVIEPLTFTPATHTRLTEEMTEIPYGFTEGYDFYDDAIYLNELFSEDWNKIGIQSIYRGGGEENVTEIQWYTIKEYAIQNYTFNFNEMDVPTSSGVTTDGDITENKAFTEGKVTLTISRKTTSSTENRFWSTSAGPQLRVYSGTLTFNVPDGYGITEIKFNHNGKWGANTVNGVEIPNDATNKVATWTLAEGEEPASEVVVAIAANSQINSIDVTVEYVGLKPVEAPEGLETETYIFSAQTLENGEEEWEDYTYQTQVGFDGNNVYFKGVSDDTADMWLKGKLSEDGKTVTIPANQYMGEFSYWGYTFPYFFTAVGEDGETMEAIVLNYDAENNQFTTDQVVVLHDGETALGEPYQAFKDVVITKAPDMAATPADPTLEDFILSASFGYSKIYAKIPSVDVDGNDLLTNKLYYSVYFEKEDVEQVYTFTADLYYNDFEEDVTEVPYSHDGYDIYKGGEIIYFEESMQELMTWKRIGLQSIYYGGGERHTSNIVWMDNPNVVPVTVSDALYATFVAPTDVDFTDAEVEAFTATINEETGNATLNPVTTVPAGTAVVVKAEKAGTFNVLKTTDTTLGAENELVAATEDVVADGTQFILSKVDDVVGFNMTTPGTTIAAGKGYLVITSAVKSFYPIGDDDATGISTIANEQLTIDSAIYNIAGQRLNKMQNGINIVNGKKVLK